MAISAKNDIRKDIFVHWFVIRWQICSIDFGFETYILLFKYCRRKNPNDLSPGTSVTTELDLVENGDQFYDYSRFLLD